MNKIFYNAPGSELGVNVIPRGVHLTLNICSNYACIPSLSESGPLLS